MTHETKHTPTPWVIEPDSRVGSITITHTSLGCRSHVAVLPRMTLCEEHGNIEANAAFIVRAVNAHDALLELAAEAMWKRDYPQGGSIYKNYESLPYHDKEIHRKEALQEARGKV